MSKSEDAGPHAKEQEWSHEQKRHDDETQINNGAVGASGMNNGLETTSEQQKRE